VGAAMFILSFVLPVQPEGFTGLGEAFGWRTGLDQFRYYLYLLIVYPGHIYTMVQEYSPAGLNDEALQTIRSAALQDHLWREVSNFMQTLTILFASIIVTIRIVLFRRFAIAPTRLSPLRVVLGLTLWAAAYCLVTMLLNSSQGTVNGQLHVGIGAYLWISSFIFIGFTLFFTKKSI